mgnify:CR=1 FL=1
MNPIKKYLSLFLLLLFLFPQVEKGLHDFSHREDAHCSSKTEKHIHKVEHSCFICDFNIPVSNIPTEQKYDIVLAVNTAYYSEYTESASLSDVDYRFSPRAPPLV